MTTQCLIEMEQVGNVQVLKISGKLDALSSHEAEKQVREFIAASEARVLLDFAEVLYMSSAGMRMLLSVYKHVTENSGHLAVCSLADEISGILRMSGFEGVICVYPDRTQALDSFPSTTQSDQE